MYKIVVFVAIIAALLTGCAVEGKAIAAPDSEAVVTLNDKFGVTEISDEYLKSTCGLIGTMAKDGYISERELRQLGMAVGTDTKYNWPEDMEKILAIIVASSRYYCYQYYDMLGE